MATRSRTRAEGVHHVEEGESVCLFVCLFVCLSVCLSGGRSCDAVITAGPKEVEFRYLSQLRQSPWPINGVYKIHHRAAHNHFKRHADIKHRGELHPSSHDTDKAV